MSQTHQPSTAHLLDAELKSLPELLTTADMTDELLPVSREQEERVRSEVQSTATDPSVSREIIMIPGQSTESVRCLLYRPTQAEPLMPAYLHIHGGGYILGNPEMSDAMSSFLCSKLGITILSVDYRLAPEHPFPAPLDDCYSALAWLYNRAADLGIDTQRIAIGGESAGGGLAAALAILARDRGEYAICHQHLTYPMIDNLTGSEERPADPLTGEFVWTSKSNQYAWKKYLGDAPAIAPQVPARLENFEGLPPMWLHTASMDLFRDENIDYAQRAIRAGVKVDLILLSGACHGWQLIPRTKMLRRYAKEYMQGLAKGLSIELAAD